MFYKRGWRGICIDPLPGTAALFKKWRPRDTIVEMGVASTPGKLTYYMFNEPALNSFDEKLSEERNGLEHYKLVNKIEMQTDSLAAILGKFAIPELIDFFSIDVEGLDLEVLKSNDWNLFRPQFIIAEVLTTALSDLGSDGISVYLASVGYEPFLKTGHSVIFKGI